MAELRPAGVVLAGGRSTRMGSDKALLPWKSGRWIDRMIQTLEALPCEKVWISGRDSWPGSVPDRPGGLGPLGGFASVLSKPGGFTHWVIVPVDMPRLTPGLLGRLLRAADHSSIDAATFEGYALPIVCRATARVIEQVESLCAPGRPSNERSFRCLARRIRTQVLPVSPIEALELSNFNSPGDLELLGA